MINASPSALEAAKACYQNICAVPNNVNIANIARHLDAYAKSEREECAKIAEDHLVSATTRRPPRVCSHECHKSIAAAIRERNQQ